MFFSEDTNRVLNYLDKLTDNNLRKRSDVGTILEVGAINNLHSLVNNIIFTGKTLLNINKIFKRTSECIRDKELLMSELNNSAEEFENYLKELIQNAGLESQDRFDEIYFSESSGAMNNIIDLAHDMAELKKLQELAKQKHRPE